MKLKIQLVEGVFLLRHVKSGLYYNGVMDKSHIAQTVMNDYLKSWGEFDGVKESESLKHFVPRESLNQAIAELRAERAAALTDGKEGNHGTELPIGEDLPPDNGERPVLSVLPEEISVAGGPEPDAPAEERKEAG